MPLNVLLQTVTGRMEFVHHGQHPTLSGRSTFVVNPCCLIDALHLDSIDSNWAVCRNPGNFFTFYKAVVERFVGFSILMYLDRSSSDVLKLRVNRGNLHSDVRETAKSG